MACSGTSGAGDPDAAALPTTGLPLSIAGLPHSTGGLPTPLVAFHTQLLAFHFRIAHHGKVGECELRRSRG